MAPAPSRSWADLPPELTGLVVGHLPARVDRVRFAAVCPEWRAAAREARLPPPAPLLTVKDGTFYSVPNSEQFRFACRTEGFATAFDNWLLISRHSCFLLLDPFTGATMTLPAPGSVHDMGGDSESDEGEDDSDEGNNYSEEDEDDSVENDNYTDEGDNDLDTGATMTLPEPGSIHDMGGDSESYEDEDNYSEEDEDDYAENNNYLEEGYNDLDTGATMMLHAPGSIHDIGGDLVSDEDGDDSEEEDTDDSDNDLDDSDVADTKFSIIKLIVCSPHLVAALFSCNGCCRIAVCRPGASLWSVAWNRTFRVTDMAFYQGRLYIIDDDDESLLAVDISIDATGDPWVARIVTVIDNPPYKTLRRMVYLVKSHGSLMMVCRRNPSAHIKPQIHTYVGLCEPEVMAFEADFARSRWVKVTTLPDSQVSFLGSCSKAVCMPQHDMQGNCIWFLDDYRNYQGWDYWYSDMESESSYGPWSWTDSKYRIPLPMIPLNSYKGRAGAAWLFPSE